VEETALLARPACQFRFGQQAGSQILHLPMSYMKQPLVDSNDELLNNQLDSGVTGMPPGLDPHERGYKSILALPLRAQQNDIGILVLLDRKADFFQPEYVQTGQEVARQLSIVMFQDLVNQQLVNKTRQLAQSNQVLKAVVDNTSSGILLCKPVYDENELVDFTYVLTNPVTQYIVGLNHDELVGKSLSAVFPVFLKNGLLNNLIDVFETGIPQQCEFNEHTQHGLIWVDISVAKVGDTLLLTAKDISHLKQTEEELQQANSVLEMRVSERAAEIQHLSAMQRAIFKFAGLGIAATDTDGIIRLINPALVAMTGYDPEELIGKFTPGVLRVPEIHSEQIDQLKPDMAGSTLTGEDLITAYVRKHNFLRRENTLLTKKGEHIPVISTVSGLFDDKETLIGFVDIVPDISYLKTIEKELVQASQRNQLAIKAGKLGLWEWNLQTDELTLDEHFYTFFNIPYTTRIRHISDLKELVHPEESIFFCQYIQEIKSARAPFGIEFRVVLPITNEVHYIKLDGLYTGNEQGPEGRMIGVIRDRTAKRKSELALVKSEKRYRSLVDHLNEVVFQTDVNGLWTFLNSAWHVVTGFTVAESLGKLFLDFVMAEDQARNQEQFAPLIARQKTDCRHIVRYIHKDGGYRWIEVFAQLTLNDQNEIIGTTGTLTDISERKKAEEAILESEQRFREIAENVDEIFWIRELNEPRFLYINPAYEKFSGQSAQHLYAQPNLFANFIVEADRRHVEQALASTDPDLSFQFRAHHQDGTIRWLNARLFMVKNEAGLLIRRIDVASDITTNIEKEFILEKSLEKERTLNSLKSQFISTASHEFRTPLAAISSSAELIKQYIEVGAIEQITPLIHRHVDTILNKVFSLSDLIADTLTISKIEEGKVKPKLVFCNLIDFCKTLIKQNFNDRNDSRQIVFSHTGKSVPVLIDPKLMTHVITNLLSIALKFSTTNPKLVVSYKPDGYVLISVIDEGIGIPNADSKNIFGKFFRASNAKTIQGTGLGLAICQEYIALQKGQIEFESKENKGTTFKITLST
jgi:PAS domain S-box-containing protein